MDRDLILTLIYRINIDLADIALNLNLNDLHLQTKNDLYSFCYTIERIQADLSNIHKTLDSYIIPAT